MRIVTARRISQVFFFALFVWFGVVSTVGQRFWQIRGWPVNWFLHLDPLTAIGTILTTHKLYRPLVWAVVTVVLTIILGRFFCSWVCPFGSLHHFTGHLANRKKTTAQKLALNDYRKAQGLKYLILVFFLGMAAFPSLAATLQTGLLDPIPLVTRSLNIVILAVADRSVNIASAAVRFYEHAWLILAVLLTAVFLNLLIPRFYCRFICPLGALFGILSRFSIWRIGKKENQCPSCKLCQRSCEGACEPAEKIRTSECVLCFNCLTDCKNGVISYQTIASAGGEITDPDVSRRGFVLAFLTGVLAVPAARLSNALGTNWNNKIIRPPGALPEEQFLNRCIKCGQCMRICPTNVIQPAGFLGSAETLFTPVLNNRIGTSGCQLNCTACGQICPTAAIRPITLAEKLGTDEFADVGPVRIGTAFVDRNRCLAWAMDKPCIVCQENCPLSPKAIYTDEYFSTVRDGVLSVKAVKENIIETIEDGLEPEKFASGDYYITIDNQRRKITANTENTIEIEPSEPLEKKSIEAEKITLEVRLQRPYVDIEKCIGCGICQHECPVSGQRAIRVSAEGQTRDPLKALLLKR